MLASVSSRIVIVKFKFESGQQDCFIIKTAILEQRNFYVKVEGYKSETAKKLDQLDTN